MNWFISEEELKILLSVPVGFFQINDTNVHEKRDVEHDFLFKNSYHKTHKS